MFKLVRLLEHSPLLVVQVHIARPADAPVVVSSPTLRMTEPIRHRGGDGIK